MDDVHSLFYTTSIIIKPIEIGKHPQAPLIVLQCTLSRPHAQNHGQWLPKTVLIGGNETAPGYRRSPTRAASTSFPQQFDEEFETMKQTRALGFPANNASTEPSLASTSVAPFSCRITIAGGAQIIIMLLLVVFTYYFCQLLLF